MQILQQLISLINTELISEASYNCVYKPVAKWLERPLCASWEMSTHICLPAIPLLSISVTEHSSVWNNRYVCLGIVWYLACLSTHIQLAGFINCIVSSNTSNQTSPAYTHFYLCILKSCFTLWDDLQVHLLVWWAQYEMHLIYRTRKWRMGCGSYRVLAHILTQSNKESLSTQLTVNSCC